MFTDWGGAGGGGGNLFSDDERRKKVQPFPIDTDLPSGCY